VAAEGTTITDATSLAPGVTLEPTATSRAARLLAMFGWTLDRALGSVLIALSLISVGATLFQVFMRYFVGRPVVWSEEVSTLAFVWLVFLGAALGVRTGEHVSMDTVVPRLPPGVRAAIDWLLRATTGLMTFTLFWFGGRLVQSLDGQTSALQWSVRWFYASVPVGAALMTVYLVRQPREDRWSFSQSALPVLVGIGLGYVCFGAQLVSAPVWNTSLVLSVSVLGLLALGLPISYALAVGVIVGYWSNAAHTPLLIVPHQVENGAESSLLLAVPFFLLAGHLMNEGGITARIINLVATLVGHITGGLSHVNCVANAIMGGLSGSSSADAAGITKILVPEMERHGYSRPYGAAVTAAASTLAQLIPPSITMLIYCSVSNASVGRMYTAGVLPGLLVMFALMGAGHLICRRRRYRGLEHRASVREMARAGRSAIWALGMPVIILGGIDYGVTTPTEAAAVAVLYALVVGTLIYRELDVRRIPRLILESALQTAAIMLIIGVSQPFSRIITLEQIPQQATELITGLTASPIAVLLLVNLLLLIIGLPLEPGPAIIMITPLLLPLAKAIGVNEIHLGIIMVTNLTMGSLTPPVGVLVFVCSTVARVPVETVFREVTPFILAILAALAVITYWPQFTLFLPNLLMGAAR
jgi:tripartite ATP-independent transporter DctM subunit